MDRLPFDKRTTFRQRHEDGEHEIIPVLAVQMPAELTPARLFSALIAAMFFITILRTAPLILGFQQRCRTNPKFRIKIDGAEFLGKVLLQKSCAKVRLTRLIFAILEDRFHPLSGRKLPFRSPPHCGRSAVS